MKICLAVFVSHGFFSLNEFAKVEGKNSVVIESAVTRSAEISLFAGMDAIFFTKSVNTIINNPLKIFCKYCYKCNGPIITNITLFPVL